MHDHPLMLECDITSFAYQVSHLILAHVTKSPFPYLNGMMLWTVLGALDANAPILFGRSVLVFAVE